MKATSLIVVADRGGLKAYRVSETATRGASLTLTQAFDVTDIIGGPSVQHTTPMSGWPQLEAETKRRVYKQLAGEIAKVVERDGEEGWSFAAPEAISAQIISLLPPEIRERIIEHVESDLVKLPVSRLSEHFRSLRQCPPIVTAPQLVDSRDDRS